MDATGGFFGVWTPRGLQDSTHGLARGVLSCARGCGLLYLLSSEGDNNRFPYKEHAHVGCRGLGFRGDACVTGLAPVLAGLQLNRPHNPECAIAKLAADAAALLLTVDYAVRWLLRQWIRCDSLIQ